MNREQRWAKGNELYRKRNPLKVLQSQFETYTLDTLGRKTAQRYTLALGRFLGAFPEHKRPEEFIGPDAQDFREAQLRLGVTPKHINYMLAVVRAFWYWMAETKRLEISNIVSVKRLKEPSAHLELSISEFTRLLMECHDARVKQAVLDITNGMSCREAASRAQLSVSHLSALYRRARKRSGIQPVPLVSLRRLGQRGLLRQVLSADGLNTTLLVAQSTVDTGLDSSLQPA